MGRRVTAHTTAQRRRRTVAFYAAAGSAGALAWLGLVTPHLHGSYEPALPDCRPGMASRCAGTTAPTAGIGTAVHLGIPDDARSVSLRDNVTGELVTTDPEHAVALMRTGSFTFVKAER
jgi:hypothetical protein